MKQTVYNRIKKRRIELDMTLLQLANQVGVTEATVQRWESGAIKNLRRENIVKLADALDTTPAYLMGWEESETAEETPRQISDEELRFALFNGKEVTDEQYAEVLRFRDYILNRPN